MKLLTQMNALFLKSIRYTSEIINRNGFDVATVGYRTIEQTAQCCLHFGM